MSEPTNESNSFTGPSLLAIPGGLLIGLGVGFLTGNIPAGLFIGLGAGFLIAMVARLAFGTR